MTTAGFDSTREPHEQAAPARRRILLPGQAASKQRPLGQGGAAAVRETVFDIREMSATYGSKKALDWTTLKIHRHLVTAVIGPSGCGKSTFIRSLNRINDSIPGFKVSGQVLYYGHDLDAAGTNRVEVRRRIGMVFQKPNPFPKSIHDHVAWAARNIGLKTGLDDRCERALRDAALWDEVKDRLDESALSLSGGQQQRLCIARAIAVEPDVLLLDEPASALDPIATASIEELMLGLKHRYTIVIGTLIEYADTAKIFGGGTTSPTGGGGQVGLLLISKYVKPASQDLTDYFDHFSLLASLEKLFGLARIGYASDPQLPTSMRAVQRRIDPVAVLARPSLGGGVRSLAAVSGYVCQCIGHGGASALAPANTLESFDAALQVSVDIVEFDVRRRRGELILAHTILDARRARSVRLHEALAHLSTARFHDIGLNVDIKHPGCEADLLQALRCAQLLDRALLSSQVPAVLDRLRRLEPSVRTGISIGGRAARLSRRWSGWRAQVLTGLASRRWDVVMAQHRLIDPALLEAVISRDGRLYAWTVNERAAIDRLRDLGVHGITTADPRLFAPGGVI